MPSNVFSRWLVLLAALTLAGVGLFYGQPGGAELDYLPAVILIAYSPSLAAIVAAAATADQAGLKSLLGPITVWRVGITWYLFALVGPFALVGGATLIYLLAGGRIEAANYFDGAALLAATGSIIAGSLGEEVGWRGLAQPVLQRRFGLYVAAVVVGIIWATWHLWPILAPGGALHATALDIVQTYVRLISTSIIYAWLLYKTRSLLLVMLAHAGHNVAIALMPPSSDAAALIVAGLYLIVALAIMKLTPRQSLMSKAQL